MQEAHKRTDWQQMFHAKKYPITDRLAQLTIVGETIPVLFMKGSHEAQGELIGLYELHKLVPNSDFIINKGCYHATPREHPELFNSRVHEWLTRVGL